MTKLVIAKRVVTAIVGLGTSKIISDIIESNTEEHDKVTDKVAMKAAAFTLGSMVADATRTYTDAKIDELVAAYNAFRAQLKND